MRMYSILVFVFLKLSGGAPSIKHLPMPMKMHTLAGATVFIVTKTVIPEHIHIVKVTFYYSNDNAVSLFNVVLIYTAAPCKVAMYIRTYVAIT